MSKRYDYTFEQLPVALLKTVFYNYVANNCKTILWLSFLAIFMFFYINALENTNTKGHLHFPFIIRTEFIDWRYNQSCWYFRPGLVNCCPSHLLSGSTLHPFPCVNTRIQCVRGGVWDSGPQTVNTCRKVPLQDNFLMTTLFCIAFPESYLSTVVEKRLVPSGCHTVNRTQDYH
jgi:hypothetical protein